MVDQFEQNPTYQVEIAFTTGSFANVTADCLHFTISRDLATMWNPLKEGEAMLVLDNSTGTYSNRNSSSPYYGKVIPNRRARIQAINRNLLTWSEDLSQIQWVANSNWVIPLGDVAPNEETTANRVMSFDTYADHTETQTLSVTISAQMVFSCYAKPAGYDYLAMRVEDGVNPLGIFNLAAGVVETASNASAFIEPSKYGYYRCSLFCSVATTAPCGFQLAPEPIPVFAPYSGDNASGSYLWGIQVESGGVLTSYIKTNSIGTPTYNLFTGNVKEVQLDPKLGQQLATMTLVDDFDKFNNPVFTTSLFANTNAATIWAAMLQLTTVASYSVSSMGTDVPLFAWWDQVQPRQAIQDLIEFGYAVCFIDGHGTLQVRNRDFDQLDAVKHVSTYYDLTYRDNTDRLVNNLSLISKQRRVSTDIRTIAFIGGGAISLPASSWVNFTLSYADPDTNESNTPAMSLATLVASQDYYTAANSDGTGTNLTSVTSVAVQFLGASAVCSLFNGGGTLGYLTRFQIRGYPAQRLPDLTVYGNDSSSQAVFGVQNYEIKNDLIGYLHAQSYRTYLINLFKEEISDIGFTLAGQYPDVLDTELGQVFTLEEPNTGLASTFTVTGVDHDVVPGGQHHLTVRTQTQRDFGYLYLDDPVKGVLDSRKLGF